MPLIREADPADYPSIRQLLDQAFAPSRGESQLVDNLRANGRIIYEWVLNDALGVAAHVCFSRAYCVEKAIGWHLAPLAVRPDVQGRGLGTELLRSSLSDGCLKEDTIFVLGEPAFYRRIGFLPVNQPTCPFDPGNEHFLALRWGPTDVFIVGYEPEFQT